jgi:hypothetical protein
MRQIDPTYHKDPTYRQEARIQYMIGGSQRRKYRQLQDDFVLGVFSKVEVHLKDTDAIGAVQMRIVSRKQRWYRAGAVGVAYVVATAKPMNDVANTSLTSAIAAAMAAAIAAAAAGSVGAPGGEDMAVFDGAKPENQRVSS